MIAHLRDFTGQWPQTSYVKLRQHGTKSQRELATHKLLHTPVAHQGLPPHLPVLPDTSLQNQACRAFLSPSGKLLRQWGFCLSHLARSVNFLTHWFGQSWSHLTPLGFKKRHMTLKQPGKFPNIVSTVKPEEKSEARSSSWSRFLDSWILSHMKVTVFEHLINFCFY